MSDLPVTTTKDDLAMQRFREYVAAGISLVIILGTVAMVLLAFQYIGSPDDQFSRVKDLLLFINPLLGVVIGYYFNKVSSDSRAETAEKAARSAVDAAQQAIQVRNQAVETAEEVKDQAQEYRDSLVQVSQLAEELVEKTEPEAVTGGKLGIESSGAVGVDQDWLRTRIGLESALERARRVLND